MNCANLMVCPLITYPWQEGAIRTSLSYIVHLKFCVREEGPQWTAVNHHEWITNPNPKKLTLSARYGCWVIHFDFHTIYIYMQQIAQLICHSRPGDQLLTSPAHIVD